MTNEKIYILGAGSIARETLSIYKDLDKFSNIQGFIEENCKKKGMKINGKRLMDASIIKTLAKNSIFIGAMGLPIRKRWIEEIESEGFDFDTAVHPSVIMGDSIDIAKGCIVYPGVILMQDIRIGRHSIIHVNSAVSHNCVIGDFVTVCPGVNIAGNVRIGDECWIGIGATIIQRVSIGKGSLIGAGAVVIKDIPGNSLAIGFPAKPIKRLGESEWKKLI